MCHKDVEAIVCNGRCLKAMACGHRCTNSCNEDCSETSTCTEMVKLIFTITKCKIKQATVTNCKGARAMSALLLWIYSYAADHRVLLHLLSCLRSHFSLPLKYGKVASNFY